MKAILSGCSVGFLILCCSVRAVPDLGSPLHAGDAPLLCERLRFVNCTPSKEQTPRSSYLRQVSRGSTRRSSMAVVLQHFESGVGEMLFSAGGKFDVE